MAPSRSPVTISSIAAALNISTATVSRALNNRKPVNPEVRRRVLLEARKRNYRPKMQASLPTVGLLTHLPISYVAQVDSALIRLSSHFNWIVETFTKDRAELLLERHLDGVIALGGMPESTDVLNRLEYIPVVIFNGSGQKRFHAVMSDHEQGAYLAGRRLVEAGHQRIAVIYNGKNWASEARCQGLARALHEADLALDEKLVFYADAPQSGTDLRQQPGDERRFIYYRGMEIINAVDRALTFRPTAIFLADEHVTTVGMAVIQGKYRLQIPEDISVIGFSTDLGMQNFCPQLTVIEQPLEDMARKCYEILNHLLAAQTLKQKSYRFPNRLVEGCSVAHRTKGM